jgi:hypothetical protein
MSGISPSLWQVKIETRCSGSGKSNYFTTARCHKLYLQYYLGSAADLQGRGVEIFESRSDENISTPLSCQSSMLIFHCLTNLRKCNIVDLIV